SAALDGSLEAARPPMLLASPDSASVAAVGGVLPFVAGGGEGVAADGGAGGSGGEEGRGGVSISLSSISRSSWRRSCDAVRRARPTHLPISAATFGRRWGPKTRRPIMATRRSSPGPMSNIVLSAD